VIPLAAPNVEGKEATHPLKECIDSTFVFAGTTGIERSEGGTLGAERQGIRADEMLGDAKTHGTAADRGPSGLADVGTQTIDVLCEHLERPPHGDVVVVLQPISPLRSADDIRSCPDRASANRSAVKVTSCEHPRNWIVRLASGDRLVPLLRPDVLVPNRQTAEAAYRLYGAGFAVSAGQIRDGRGLLIARHGGYLDEETFHRSTRTGPSRCLSVCARS
jgi:hypothetical protein